MPNSIFIVFKGDTSLIKTMPIFRLRWQFSPKFLQFELFVPVRTPATSLDNIRILIPGSLEN